MEWINDNLTFIGTVIVLLVGTNPKLWALVQSKMGKKTFVSDFIEEDTDYLPEHFRKLRQHYLDTDQPKCVEVMDQVLSRGLFITEGETQNEPVS